ncbi:MAG: metallopeptidase family protein [Candidatus Omnitrophica bacterium]|nr:metallopeptidase family protein [Candidatus Omnitrophota bacterium]
MVQRALDELPGDFGKRLENIEVIVEDMPDMETAKSLKLGSKGRLLGLYQGVPLKARTHYYGMVMPDKITLFKSNIERTCQENDLDAYGEIKHVLEHEIAHHFGITDERLKDLGAY